jgi:hypothetical protein
MHIFTISNEEIIQKMLSMRCDLRRTPLLYQPRCVCSYVPGLPTVLSLHSDINPRLVP